MFREWLQEKSQVLGTEALSLRLRPPQNPQIAAGPGPEPPLGRGKTGMQNLTLKTHWMIIWVNLIIFH